MCVCVSLIGMPAEDVGESLEVSLSVVLSAVELVKHVPVASVCVCVCVYVCGCG